MEDSFKARQILKICDSASARKRKQFHPLDIIKAVQAGFPFSALTTIIEEYKISRDAVCKVLNISPRNYLRRKQQKRLSATESDRLYRLARILVTVNDLFQDPEETGSWMRDPHPRFGNKSPISVLDTEIGAREIEQLIGRIEHGIIG